MRRFTSKGSKEGEKWIDSKFKWKTTHINQIEVKENNNKMEDTEDGDGFEARHS